MKLSDQFDDHVDAFVRLFTTTFTASEGAEEGTRIGTLARNLLTTSRDDVRSYSAWIEEHAVGCIIFSRLTFPHDDRSVYIMGPVAVDPAQQRRGIGQTLIKYGLGGLRNKGVDIAMTYGDPNYYAKVGFKPVTAAMARPPRTLQHPEGWLAQSLTDRPLSPLEGPSTCVEALDHPEYW